MKIKITFGCLFILCTLTFQISVAQIPAAYHFDRQIVQVLSGKKMTQDSSRIDSYFTNSGEYFGLRLQGIMSRHTGWIIVNRNGAVVFFNDREKTATLISIRKIVSDVAGMAKWIKMDSVLAAMRRRAEGKEARSVKTGNTKTVEGFQAEAFTVTDSAGRVSTVWCAKLDFPTPVDYVLSAGAGKWLSMISGKLEKHPLFQALVIPGNLVTEIQYTDSTGKTHNILHTETIRRSQTDFSTTGYTVIDYSKYSLPEIFQAEMRRSMK